MSPEREQAELLLGKAREDQAVTAKLVDDLDIADSAVGFHVLGSRRGAFRRGPSSFPMER